MLIYSKLLMTAEKAQLNFVASTSFFCLVKLFAAQPATFYTKGCGHKQRLQLMRYMEHNFSVLPDGRIYFVTRCLETSLLVSHNSNLLKTTIYCIKLTNMEELFKDCPIKSIAFPISVEIDAMCEFTFLP